MTNQRLVAATLSIAVASSLHAQTNVYVDDDAPDGGDGLSWNSAFNDLHDAIDLAVSLGQNRGEIRIGEGFYRSEGNPFEIPLAAPDQTPMRVFGGYAGYSLPNNPDLRVVDSFQSVLSSEGYSNTIVLTSAVTLGPAGGGRPMFAGALSATTLDGLTVRGGNATAIYNTDRFLSLRINNCSVVGVQSRSGGAVNLKDLSVTINQSLFALNEYTQTNGGGALYISGGMSVISDSEFIGNSSNNMGGGAIRINDGGHWLSNCRFYANSSRIDGGAVYADAAIVNLEYCEFVGNEVAGNSGDGGAAWIRVNRMPTNSPVAESLFTDNRVPGDGGAIALQFVAPDDAVYSIKNTEFYNNSAGGSGGAVSRAGTLGSRVYAENCTFIDNVARNGGAIEGNIIAERSSFIRNTASEQGGAVCGTYQSHIYNCEFFDNYAGHEGGGAYAVSAITLSNFDGNSAGFRGGVASNIRKFVSVVATNNSAPIGAGGYDIRDIRFSDIHHNDGGGVAGGVYHVENTIISDNNGPGIAYEGSNIGGTFSVHSSTIARNDGRGILFMNQNRQCELVVNNTNIVGNTGCGLELSRISSGESFGVFLEKCTIAGNVDGGIKVLSQPSSDRGQVALVDSLLHTNNGRAVDTNLDTDVILAGCTIIGTGAAVGAPVVIGMNSTLIAESTIIEALDSQYTIDLTNSDALLIQCMLTGGVDSIAALSDDNIEVIGSIYDESPGFISRAGTDGDPVTWSDNDYRLTLGSGAIDRGSNLLFAVGRDTDLDGLDRRVDDIGMPDDSIGFAPFADIGAYEFQGATCVGDLNNNGITDPADFSLWMAAFNSMSRRADQNLDGVISPPDFLAWLANYATGCQ